MTTSATHTTHFEPYGDFGGIYDLHQHFAANGRFIGRSYRSQIDGEIKAQHTHPRSGAMTLLPCNSDHEAAHAVIVAFDNSVS